MQWTGIKGQKLLVVPAEGGPARELLAITEPDRLAYGGAYAWTPDSRFLLVAHGEFRDSKFSPDVWIVALDGSPPRKIGLARHWMRYLSVHPDGRRIAFQSGASDWELWSLENFLPPAPARR